MDDDRKQGDHEGVVVLEGTDPGDDPEKWIEPAEPPETLEPAEPQPAAKESEAVVAPDAILEACREKIFAILIL